MSGDWNLFVQWKGTYLCADFVCPSCSKQDHIDAEFCYAIECLACGGIWRLPVTLALERISPGAESCTVKANDPEYED